MWVPGRDHEAVRDLTRAREDMKAMEVRARQRLGAFLLRHGRVYHGKSRWTQAHFRWLEEQKFDFSVQQVVFQEYVDAVKAAQARTAGLEAQMREVLATWSLRPTAEALMSLRGVATITAMTILARTRRSDALRFAPPAGGLPRAGPRRVLVGYSPAPGSHHQDRQWARSPAADRGGVGVSLPGEKDGPYASQGSQGPGPGAGHRVGGGWTGEHGQLRAVRLVARVHGDATECEPPGGTLGDLVHRHKGEDRVPPHFRQPLDPRLDDGREGIGAGEDPPGLRRPRLPPAIAGEPWSGARRLAPPPRWRGSSPTRRVQRPSCAVAVGGVRGGRAPRQPLPGTREAWPQRVGWLPSAKHTRRPTLGNLGRQHLHTRTLRSPLHAVSTTGKEAMSQGFQRRTIGGPSPASGRPRADPGALSATHREADGDLGDRLVCPRPGTSPVVSLMHADVLVWLEDPGGSAAPPSIPDLWLRRNSPPRGPTRWISGSWSPSAKKSALTASESLLSACRGRGMGRTPQVAADRRLRGTCDRRSDGL